MKYIGTWVILAAAGIILAATSCKKEVKGPDMPALPTVWERAEGRYNVYDTLGIYLYEMEIIHWRSKDQYGMNVDSLRFVNFDGEFVFSARQLSPNPSNYPNYILIGSHNELHDSQSKRWKIHSGAIDHYNQLINDTINLFFQKTNINYYLSDLTPYYSCDCKQIAVKQH